MHGEARVFNLTETRGETKSNERVPLTNLIFNHKTPKTIRREARAREAPKNREWK